VRTVDHDRLVLRSAQRHAFLANVDLLAGVEGPQVSLRPLFADDPNRGERPTVEAAGLFLDYSKNRAMDETLRLLVQRAQESGLQERRDAIPGRWVSGTFVSVVTLTAALG